jgi:hypothetical protein
MRAPESWAPVVAIAFSTRDTAMSWWKRICQLPPLSASGMAAK